MPSFLAENLAIEYEKSNSIHWYLSSFGASPVLAQVAAKKNHLDISVLSG